MNSDNTDIASTAEEKAWERATIEKLVFESIQEHRRSRRWKIGLRIVYLLLFVGLIILFQSQHSQNYINRSKSHTAIINLKGEISADSAANADDILDSLIAAFEDKKTKGIILHINSPGGSPVQSGEIFDGIMHLRKQHPDIKIYAVCADTCASGSYYVAAATDAIYVNKASIVGSIGVLMNGFGFVDTLHKLGVQRRLLTSGKYKGMLDPFSPLQPLEETFAQGLLNDIHDQFIASVKLGRGSRLKNDPNLFTGLFWTGDKAVKLGLADGLGSPQDIANNIIKEPLLVDYTKRTNLFSLLADGVGTSAAQRVLKNFGLLNNYQPSEILR